jgi:hypothetical protein
MVWLVVLTLRVRTRRQAAVPIIVVKSATLRVISRRERTTIIHTTEREDYSPDRFSVETRPSLVMMSDMRPKIVLLLLSMCLLSLGCSSRDQTKPVYATKGRVLYNTQPLVGAKITFYPIDRVMLPRETPTATTDAEGNFVMSTYGSKDGAPTGYYRVTIVPADHNLDSPYPLTYVDPMRSGLKAQVNSAATELPTIELKGPGLK